MSKTLVALVALALFGCATSQPYTEEQKQALTPIHCANKAECDLAWQKTQLWVVANSGYRIQMANEVIIQTYGPSDSRMLMAFTVTREPDGKGGALLRMRAACDNWIECDMRPIDALVSYRKYITSPPGP